MSDKAITIHLPEHVLEHYTHIADQLHQSVEAVIVVQLTENFVPEIPDVSSLSDSDLWALVEQRMTEQEYERLETLIEQAEPLTAEEEEEVEQLSRVVDSQMMARSVALAELNQRGYETSHFFKITS